MSLAQPQRVALEPAYLLHRRAYRETSLLLDVFSEEHGKLALLAKGVRGKQGGLAPFRRLLLSWSGKGELPVLTGHEPACPALPLQGASLYCGLYLNELLQAFLPRHDPQPLLFQHYTATLAALAQPGSPELSLRRFELALLTEMGYGLQLQHDAEQHGEIQPERWYRYLPERGPLPSANTADAVRGATLIALREERLDDPDSRREAKRLLRRIIDHHLAGRTLKSRELFRKVTL